MERKPISEFGFPPGFRFHPSDEELIIHYLQNKVFSRALPASVIAEVNLYKHNPWELPKKALFGEDEWYFFSPRDRKYPNGARPNRAAASGYWKATGTDKPILGSASEVIGVKKALVFYKGRPRRGLKTDWIMNEYRLLDTKFKPSKSKGSMRLDDWVLCRVRQRGIVKRNRNTYDAQDSPSKEFVGCLPITEEVDLTSTNYNNEMIIDCLRKDCRLLASILAGQSLSPMATFPCASFQESIKYNSFISSYADDRDKMHSPETVPPFENHDPLIMKINEVDRYDESLLPYMELQTGNRNADLLPYETFPDSYVSNYSQNQSQDGFYNSNLPGPINGFLELDEFAFSSKYLQL